MLRSNFIFALLFFIICGLNLFAQTEKLEFKDFKIEPEGKIVYFKITGIQDQVHSDKVSLVLTQDKNVSNCAIFKSSNDYICKLIIKNNAEPEYFRKILAAENVDIDKSALTTNSKNKSQNSISEHHPVFTDTGNPEADKNKYEKDKHDWMKNYPKEVVKVTGRNYYQTVANEPFYLKEEPSYIDTGDIELDKKMFEKRKLQWNNAQGQKK